MRYGNLSKGRYVSEGQQSCDEVLHVTVNYAVTRGRKNIEQLPEVRDFHRSSKNVCLAACVHADFHVSEWWEQHTEPSIISGTGAIWSKTNSGSTGHRCPPSSPHPRAWIVPGASKQTNKQTPWSESASELSTIFKMHPGSHVLWVCSEPPAILTRPPQLCQNAAFQFHLQSGKQREAGWVEDDSHVVFDKRKFLVKKEVWDGALSWCNNKFFCR
jgi:hypothetical protein